MYKELQQLKNEFEEIKSNVSLTQQILSGKEFNQCTSFIDKSRLVSSLTIN